MKDKFYLRVAGTSFHQDAVLATQTGDQCKLEPEPTNEHDRFAVRVLNTKLEDGLLGYVPKEQNRVIHDALCSGCTITAIVESISVPVGATARGVLLRLEVIYPDSRPI